MRVRLVHCLFPRRVGVYLRRLGVDRRKSVGVSLLLRSGRRVSPSAPRG